MSWLYTIIFAGLVASSQGGTAAIPEGRAIQTTPVVAVQTQDVTERFEQTYPLNANGRLKLSNLNGSVTLEAWDRNEVKLEYVKTADSKERLQYVQVRIDPRPDYLSIVADYDDWKQNGDAKTWQNNCCKLQVEFHLMVPRGANINEIETVNGSISLANFTNFTKASAVNGGIKALNVRGTANLSTVNGEVAAEFDRLDLGSKISLDTVNGKANLTIPSDASATLKADSLNGNITNDFGLPVRKGKYIGRDMYGRLGAGDVQIKLSAVNGSLLINRKNDGKALSPATNLLTQKDNDEDWDKDKDNDNNDNDEAVQRSVVKASKVNKQVDKSAKAAEKTATKAAVVDPKPVINTTINPEIGTLMTQSIERSAEAMAKTLEATEALKVERAVRDQMRQQQERLPRIVEANFNTPMPRIEKQGGSFTIRGAPTVTVEAPDCGVKIQGWDKPTVQYRVVRFSDARSRGSVKVSEDHSDTTINLRVGGIESSRFRPFVNDFTQARLEVYVPRHSNLKINAGGEIRLDGVSGDIELTGSDDPINVRDVSGKLQVTNSDGHIRVIGFRGEVVAETSDGMINLEGDFIRLKASSESGPVILTLPDNASADLAATCDHVKGDGIDVTRISGDAEKSQYRIGKGGSHYEVSTDGEIQIRGSGSLKEKP